MMTSNSFLIAFAVALSAWSAEAFSPPSTANVHQRTTASACSSDSRCSRPRGVTSLAMSSVEASLPLSKTEEEDDDDDDEMEWVEEEFELLTERDFYNTEWKIGTLMDNKPKDPKSIDTTWVRLVTNDSGENVAIWGDDSKGKWTIDVASQFFSISKETFGGWFGKQIWAGTVEDFYYLDGTVRGWGPISPASVDGQWQAVRLGVVDGERVGIEERGEAPWFMVEEDELEEEDESEGVEMSAIAAAQEDGVGDD